MFSVMIVFVDFVRLLSAAAGRKSVGKCKSLKPSRARVGTLVICKHFAVH